MSAARPRTPNRLAAEKSPYLLQHQYNPVDWYPWGEEAFRRAREEQKPIFLSVGYSTCHWCHVMERESFENEAIAELMNRHFVNVKVDREERPDVDRVYMAFVQATTGSGGWPMSVFLTPDLEPFFGGTYFPPEDRYGRPGFPTVLRSIARAWEERRQDLVRSAAEVLRGLRRATEETAPPALLGPGTLELGYRFFAQVYDREYGGFGRPPKFPRPVVHDFLLRWYSRSGQADAAWMVVETLAQMARGGVYDHLGGGFHRYSVDRFWHVPHFEKMLYDQAQLVTSLVEAWQVRPDPLFRRVARETCDYVLRDLEGPEGGFFSAEDADSPVAPGSEERAEGAFYVWTKDEIVRALGDLAGPFCAYYSIVEEGNADDPHGELVGKNILHVGTTVEKLAASMGRLPGEVEKLLEEGRRRLLEARGRRPRPHLDDKILCGWNGLMIGALARAAGSLGEPRYLEAARRAAAFVRRRLYREPENLLWRRFRDGEAGIEAYLEDYAMLIEGLVALYEADFDLEWLRWAERLCEQSIEHFYDPGAGGFFSTSGRDPTVLIRMKEDYDGAEPSGNSVMAGNLLALGELLGRPEWTRLAGETIRCFSGRLQQHPYTMPRLLCALDYTLGSTQVVIAGERNAPDTEALLGVLRTTFVPQKVVLLADEATRAALEERLPWIRGMAPQAGRAAAYVCREYACERPVTDPDELRRLLPARTLFSEDPGESPEGIGGRR